MEKILEFMFVSFCVALTPHSYTGNCTLDGDLSALISASHRFELSALKQRTESQLSERVDESNVLEMLALAVAVQAKRLQSVCTALVVSRMQQFRAAAMWKRLAVEVRLVVYLGCEFPIHAAIRDSESDVLVEIMHTHADRIDQLDSVCSFANCAIYPILILTSSTDSRHSSLR
jgi:hypothetical protein